MLINLNQFRCRSEFSPLRQLTRTQCSLTRIYFAGVEGPLGGVYTKTFSTKNDEYFSLRFSLPFTPKRWKRIPKTETFESGDLSGDLENGASKNARKR